MPKKEVLYERLMNYSLRLLARKRYTTFEMEEKLKKFVLKRQRYLKVNKTEEEVNTGAMSESAIAKVMGRLSELNYLNDQQFADDYVAERTNLRPRGKFLLESELKRKGISKEMVNSATQAINFDESEVAYKLLEKFIMKKKNILEKLDRYKQKQKYFQYLASKGFNGDAIYKAVERCYSWLED